MGCGRDESADRWAAVAAVVITMVTLLVGYAAFGLVTMLVFTAGFAGGLLLWLVFPSRGTWADIKVPYWCALAVFVAHRVEEKQLGFFAYLSEVTGVPTPAVVSAPVIALLLISVGGWLLIPVLMVKVRAIGSYLAWTFFASLGITELAHFVVFPLLDPPNYGYVPGMATVVVLAPIAWWGMWRLARGHSASAALATTVHGG